MEPIEAIWLSPHLHFGLDPHEGVHDRFREWKDIFDALVVAALPPTWVNHEPFFPWANEVQRVLDGDLILATLTVGKEGWEESNNEETPRNVGLDYDGARALSQEDWLELWKNLEAETWVWVLNAPAEWPTIEQATGSAEQFVRFAKQMGRKVVVSFSAGRLLSEPELRVVRQVAEVTQELVDRFLWMDLDIVWGLEGQSLDKLLDTLVSITPVEKTMPGWFHSPNIPRTNSVEGTVSYIETCQARGINQFTLFLSGMERLGDDPWRDFYRGLPKTGHD